MKLLLSFVMCFEQDTREINIIDYIFNSYNENITHQKKPKQRVEKTPHHKLKQIFHLLEKNRFPTDTREDRELEETIAREIADILEVDADLDEIFILKEMKTTEINVLRYTLFGQKFKVLVQYCGRIAKIYFNNTVKVVKCWIHDGKAWTVLSMRHNFKDMNEEEVNEICRSEHVFSLEYNNTLVDKKVRDNDIEYDGYLCPYLINEFDTMFATEIQQLTIFTEKIPEKIGGKEDKDTLDLWNIPINSHLVGGIVDEEQRNKIIDLIPVWQQEMNSFNFMQIEEKIPPSNEEAEKSEQENVTKKKKKLKVETKQDLKEDINNDEKLDIEVPGAHFFSDGTSSRWFYNAKKKTQCFGLFFKVKDPLTPEVSMNLKPIRLTIGHIYNLPTHVLIKYGVSRVYAQIDFVHPMDNLKTIPQTPSKTIELNYFQMSFFTHIQNYQRLFAAFHLKHLTIKLIGEVVKEKKTKEPEEITDNNEAIAINESKQKKQGTKFKKRKRKKKSAKNEINENKTELKPDTGVKDKPDVDPETNIIPTLKGVNNEETVKENSIGRDTLPESVIVSEDENVTKIRICLFRVDLSDFVKYAHFHLLKETLTHSAVYDKNETNKKHNTIESDSESRVDRNSLENTLKGSNTKSGNPEEYIELIDQPNKNMESELPNQNRGACGTHKLTTIKEDRQYLIGIEYKQPDIQLEFEFEIQACFKKLCRELYLPGSKGLNNIFVIFEDPIEMKRLVENILYHNRVILQEISVARTNLAHSFRRHAITGFALQYSDMRLLFVETTIQQSFPKLLQNILDIEPNSIRRLIYNKELIVPDRVYSDLIVGDTKGLFTYESQRSFSKALRRKSAPQDIYVSLSQLIRVNSIEEIHKHQLLPDIHQLNSLTNK